MRLPHNAFVLVADGRKMLFFRNEGDGEFPDLKVQDAQEQADPARTTDAAGNAPGAGGAGGGSLGGTDPHQQAEDRFAVDCADMLKRRVLAHEVEQLAIIAPPRTLGELRKHLHKEVERRVVVEIAKDLTGHPVADIEAALTNA